jgi:hypothetical protein
MGVSGDCDPSTSIVGDGSPEKAQIARALRVAALVAASPDLAQTSAEGGSIIRVDGLGDNMMLRRQGDCRPYASRYGSFN